MEASKAATEDGWRYYGWVEYTHPLDFEHVWQYELHPADPAELEQYWEWRDEEGM